MNRLETIKLLEAERDNSAFPRLIQLTIDALRRRLKSEQALSQLNLQFRELSPQEELEFRQWVRDNYTIGEPINELWHPVVRDEIQKMKEEGA